MKHGCCIDKLCGSSTCMELPTGQTCSTCLIFNRCKVFLGLTGKETSCDWFPRRFVQAPVGGKCGAAELNAKESELHFLRLEAEDMALSLEAIGYGRHLGGRMCTPLERYRDKYPKAPVGGKEGNNDH